MKYSRNKGFSLVELLLTLSIIVILSITAFFIYSKVSQNEKDNELISAINEVAFAMKDVSKTNNNIDMSVSTYSSFSVLLSPNSQKQIENYGMIYSNQTGLYPNMFEANGKALYYGVMLLQYTDTESFCKRVMPKIYSQTNNYGIVIGTTFFKKGEYNATQIINACDSVGTAMKVAFIKTSMH